MTCVPTRSESPPLCPHTLHSRDSGSLSVLNCRAGSCPRTFAFAVALQAALLSHAFAWLAPRSLHPGFSDLLPVCSLHCVLYWEAHRVTSNHNAFVFAAPLLSEVIFVSV